MALRVPRLPRGQQPSVKGDPVVSQSLRTREEVPVDRLWVLPFPPLQPLDALGRLNKSSQVVVLGAENGQSRHSTDALSPTQGRKVSLREGALLARN